MHGKNGGEGGGDDVNDNLIETNY